jgi:hypothetical protein
MRLRNTHKEITMRSHISARVLRGAVVSIFLFGAVAFATLQVNAQNQGADDIQTRLKAKGIPVRSVTTISRAPFQVEITLNSQSKDHNLTLDDNWSMILANREATMAYRIGARLNSYRINVINANGELISSSDTYVYPDDSSQNITTKKSLVSGQQAKAYAFGQLNLAGLQQSLIDVLPEDNLGSSGQILMVQLTATDVTAANQAMPVFLDSLFKLLDTVNSKQGSSIVLCHVRIVDKQGNALFDLVKDLEAGQTQWTGVAGITYDDWFPHPLEVVPTPDQSIPPSRNVAPTTNPAVIVGYPAPGPTPTLPPYPYPYP